MQSIHLDIISSLNVNKYLENKRVIFSKFHPACFLLGKEFWWFMETYENVFVHQTTLFWKDSTGSHTLWKQIRTSFPKQYIFRPRFWSQNILKIYMLAWHSSSYNEMPLYLAHSQSKIQIKYNNMHNQCSLCIFHFYVPCFSYIFTFF